MKKTTGVSSNNQLVVTKKKFKLKKKWRFWRVFKRYCLFRSASCRFFKFRLLFDRKRIIWHNLRNVYGSQAKQWVYYNRFSKFACGVRFLQVLVHLETRLNIFALRLGFAKTLGFANSLIESGIITINKQIKNKNFLVTSGDLVCKAINPKSFTQTDGVSTKLLGPQVKFFVSYFFSQKRRWRKRRKFKYFWRIKKTAIVNYVLFNYKVNAVVLIRKPLMGEVLLKQDKRLVSWQLIKKVYLLY